MKSPASKTIPLLATEDEGARHTHDGVDERTVVRATRVVGWVFVMLIAFGAWAYFLKWTKSRRAAAKSSRPRVSKSSSRWKAASSRN